MNGQNPTDGNLPSSRSPVAVRADNLIRRFLRVSNPNNPNEIADGLLRLYPGAAREQQLEEAGLPFYRVQTVEVGGRQDGAPATVELVQGRNDTGRDLDSLLHNAVLKDIQPELRGWQSAIDGIIADASQTARFALDPRQRDRTYASRRLLGDYARVARFVGALTPYLNADYRSLAKSLDEVASVLLVTMGDAIANIGFGGGRFLLQAPASELQERREAVLAALRNLNGSVQTSYNQSTWPWGLDALRRILTRLDANGQSDLRVLFQENTVAQIMDDLIARASTPGADGLRALGSTAALSLQQLRRLVFVAQNLDPESPPLAAYLNALLLFIEGFAQGASGSRLLYIARPPIVFYGLYGIGGPDQATRTLINLVIARGAFADLIDCVLECSCTPNDIIWQILLDKVLYDLDRAIDYFSLGSDPLGQGEPENRARTFGLIIEYLLNFAGIHPAPLYSLPPLPDPRGQGELPIMLTGVRDLLIGPRPIDRLHFFNPPSRPWRIPCCRSFACRMMANGSGSTCCRRWRLHATAPPISSGTSRRCLRRRARSTRLAQSARRPRSPCRRRARPRSPPWPTKDHQKEGLHNGGCSFDRASQNHREGGAAARRCRRSHWYYSGWHQQRLGRPRRAHCRG